MEKWRRVWRYGIAPQLSLAGLEALYIALVKDSHELIQDRIADSTYVWTDGTPKPVICRACPIGFCAWRGDGLSEEDDVKAYFYQISGWADRKLNYQCEFANFARWICEVTRETMRLELITEVVLAIAEKKKGIV